MAPAPLPFRSPITPISPLPREGAMSQQYIGTGRITGTTTSVAVTSVSAQTTTMSAQTYKVRVAANTAIHIKNDTSTTVTATAADVLIPANSPEYFTVSPGSRLAAIKASTNGLVTSTDGTVWFTELA